MSDGSTASELMVLQAIRLAGVADQDAILDRTFLPDDVVDRVLTGAVTTHYVEPFRFGDSSGWIISQNGSTRLSELLRAEVSGGDTRRVLEKTLEAFDPLNDRFVALVSRWQVKSTSATDGGFSAATAAEGEHLLGALSACGADLRGVLSDLVSALPRFGRYPAQYDAAVGRAGKEGLRWVTGVGLLSCHVVWAELHQDLLSTLGRDRLSDQNG